ncbi:hypothetical protein P0082_09595 [Candidatus Haliotispira prima]|uniref:DUF2802 domain-containing protein n=1 Tax=Candidatus Haliotispira prima TaxID=3034016 RepID=A0ABY8MFF9_9SPIO|nr:hypothetical protein P0082_09595 [Candidatus Haliotispira prima]
MLTTIYVLVLINLSFLVSLFFFFRLYIRRELGKVSYVRHLEKELQQLVMDVNRSGGEITEVIEDRIRRLNELLPEQERLQQEWERKAEELGKQNYNMEQQQLRLRELKQDGEGALESFRLRVLNLEEQLSKNKERFGMELFRSLSAKVEGELLHGARLESEHWQRDFAERQQRLERDLSEDRRNYAELAELVATFAVRSEAGSADATKPAEFPAAESEQAPEPELEQEPKQARTEQDVQETRWQTRLPEPALRSEIEQYADMGLDARIISQKTGVPLNLVEILVSVRG